MAMFENSTALADQMKIELAKKEYQMADGSIVTNLEGICQHLIGRALDGDLNCVSLISDLIGGKK
jgi:hypothetical protein